MIKKASQKVDYLIVSVHWGKEYKIIYKKLQAWAEMIFKAGGDCIIGHHPHILLPLQYEKRRAGYKKIVIYSGDRTYRAFDWLTSEKLQKFNGKRIQLTCRLLESDATIIEEVISIQELPRIPVARSTSADTPPITPSPEG